MDSIFISGDLRSGSLDTESKHDPVHEVKIGDNKSGIENNSIAERILFTVILGFMISSPRFFRSSLS